MSSTNSSPRVALVSGFWGQNIGNAFFNVGGKWLLQQVFGESEVDYILDQPGYRTFHDQSKGNPKNDWGLLQHLDVDYVVLQGPMLTTTFRALWEPTFKTLQKRGTKIILLSAALFRHKPEEIEANRRFLKEYPPAIFSTRDRETFEAFKDVCDWTYNGIDSAWFVPDAYRPFRLAAAPYVAVNFDRYPEPAIWTDRSGRPAPDNATRRFPALDREWALTFPKLSWKAASRGKWQAYLGALTDRRELPDEIDEFQIVRPEHRVNPHITWKVYRRPNAVASDEPFTYFTTYANAALTISDRVHACVATLAYGNPAMLTTESPRSRLFDRVGVGDVRERAVKVDMERLQREKQDLVAWLKKAREGIEAK